MRRQSSTHVRAQRSLQFLNSGEQQSTQRIRERTVARLQTESLGNFCIHLNLQLNYVHTLVGLFACHLLFLDLIQLLVHQPAHKQQLFRRWAITVGRNVCIHMFVVSSFCSFYGSLRHRLAMYRWHAWLLVGSIVLLSVMFVTFGIQPTMSGNVVGGWMFGSQRLQQYYNKEDRYFNDRFRLPELRSNIDALQTGLKCCGFNGFEDWQRLTPLDSWKTAKTTASRLLLSHDGNVSRSKKNAEIYDHNLSSRHEDDHFVPGWFPSSCCSPQTYQTNSLQCRPELTQPGCRYRINLYNELTINYTIRWLCLAYLISTMTLPASWYLLQRFRTLHKEEQINESKLVAASAEIKSNT